VPFAAYWRGDAKQAARGGQIAAKGLTKA